ncbi:MAG: hypothetical protein HEEMFOPI_01238 [Holosporales bacterium]
MFSYFKNIKIFQKLLYFNILFLCGVFVNVYLSYNIVRESVIEQRKEKLKNFVESATSYMHQIACDVQKGSITEEEAKEKIFYYIDSTRFDHGNYFWIHNKDCKMVKHPISEKLNNTDISELHDPNGVYIFKEFNKVISKYKEGYVEYLWPKPGEALPVEKVSYIAEFAPFNWVVGSGMYLDNLRLSVWELCKKDLFIILFFSLLFQAIVLLFSRSIAKPFKGIETTINKLIHNHHEEILIPENLGDNEIGMMYKSLKKLNETFLVNARLKNSIDSADLPLMIIDQDDVIVYNNKAMDRLYEKHRKLFSKCFLSTSIENIFSTRHLQDINPIFSDSLLNLMIPLQTKIDQEDSVIIVKAHPVLNLLSDKIGVVVQFEDITQETSMQKQIESVIHEVAGGNLSIRLDAFKMSGFFKTLASSINDFIDLIDKAISDIGRSMKALSTGNLTQRIDSDYKGTLESVKNDTNRAISELEGVMHRIVSSSNDLLNASEGIYKGSQELSQRTEQQASSLEETAASMEQLASTVRQTTEHASGANRLASKTKSLATDGGAIVQNTIVAMQSIDESFKKIDSIVLVMDEIAFQTNLLALNAAVEAARAGETGKGFAVVAEEVRTLAQRSAQASKQIKMFMEESSENVKNGVSCVNNTGERLNEIVDAARDVANLIAEIAGASEEQTSGLEQINVAISEMDHMTQANAAFVEKSTASADLLNQQADDLMAMMKFFTFNQSLEEINKKEDAEKSQKNNNDLKDIDLDLSTFTFQEEDAKIEPVKPKSNSSTGSVQTLSDDTDWKDF